MAQSRTQSSHKPAHKAHADALRLTRKDGVYYYRRRLPRHLGTEVSVSLGTRNFREAEHLAQALDLIYSRRVTTVSDLSGENSASWRGLPPIFRAATVPVSRCRRAPLHDVPTH